MMKRGFKKTHCLVPDPDLSPGRPEGDERFLRCMRKLSETGRCPKHGQREENR